MKFNWKEALVTIGLSIVATAIVFRALPASVRKVITGA
jgi:hypothetical protein